MESVSESKANTELVAVDNSATNQEESSSLLNRPDAPKKHNSIFLNSFNFYLKSNQNSTKELTMKLSEQQKYILALEKILEENQLSKPSREEFMQLVKVHVSSKKAVRESLIGLLRNLKPADLQGFLDKLKSVSRTGTYAVSFRDFGIWTISTPTRIATVGSQLCTPCLNIGKSRRYDILKDLTGCIYPGRLTLLVGPPGSGKSTFLKAVCGRRIGGSDLKFDGQIFYNDEDIKTTDKFLLPKVSEYIEQNDTHAPTLTVEETLAFAWECSSGGHHSYCIAKDEEAAKWLDAEDATKSKVMNVQYLIGLEGCKNTYVGDGTIRGVSGGQKRRVTLGEMFVTPRRVKMMDSISNGLDSATTFDIVKSIRGFVTTFSTTSVVSLLQPPPEVFDLFDDVIVMCAGQIIYQGPRVEIIAYFNSIGYECPFNVDMADFLQVIPTSEGILYMQSSEKREEASDFVEYLTKSWKATAQFQKLVADVEKFTALHDDTKVDEETGLVTPMKTFWYKELNEEYPGTYWYHLDLVMRRAINVYKRDKTFIAARIGQNLFVGAVAGSLFNNISPTSVQTMNGFLFFTALFGALTGFSMLPGVFDQKAVFYKHAASLFYPASCLTLAQALVLMPQQLVETILFSTIMYWTAGLSSEYNGSRFLTFVILLFVFNVSLGQMFRMIAYMTPDMTTAAPVGGVLIVLCVLFSGFILPASQISDGWIWFYWINPVSWVLKGVTVNQFLSSTYNFNICVNSIGGNCTQFQEFGDYVLTEYGNPTEQAWVWYAFGYLIGCFFLFFGLSTFFVIYVHTESAPPAPVYEHKSTVVDSTVSGEQRFELPFDPVSFAFLGISYVVKTNDGEELTLLDEVTGVFEPGVVTALMGSSGAGKTTLLDVLSGRKTTGTITGNMFINGYPKQENHFRRIMGYVEQFDTLSVRDTARDAVEFSAALRLPGTVSKADREKWVETVVDLLELRSIANLMVGTPTTGGMSFEQKKRVSIGVELASNPAILFLDEPTTGLDSRAAQVVMRGIRRVAASGRSVVCTIHQPSFPIFNMFDALLLLKRGGKTVFFGPLGENCKSLVEFFEAAPEVTPIKPQVNPATWMLDVIGAGTSTATKSVDYHEFYAESALCLANEVHAIELSKPVEGMSPPPEVADGEYVTSFAYQFSRLMYRQSMFYWRTPGYNVTRVVISIVVAAIFGSAYPQQTYFTSLNCVARIGVIYITTLFIGVIGLQTVVPVAFDDRPPFYRERQSNMYSTVIYTIVNTLVEIPYLIVTSFAFVLPFFYIVGFNNIGNVAEKFMYYWLFVCLYIATLVTLGQMCVSISPTRQVSNIIASVTSVFYSLFSGYMIQPQSIPNFWLFVYFLNPLHYAFEGIVVTQFKGDTTPVTVSASVTVTAETFVENFFTTWDYTQRNYCVLALFVFIIFYRMVTYVALVYLNFDKR